MLLKQRPMRWLGHVVIMEDGRIPKDLLYGELAHGMPDRAEGLTWDTMMYANVTCLPSVSTTWEVKAAHRAQWCYAISDGLSDFEQKLRLLADLKRTERKARSHSDRPAIGFINDHCSRDCHSNIGLFSHNRRCSGKFLPTWPRSLKIEGCLPKREKQHYVSGFGALGNLYTVIVYSA